MESIPGLTRFQGGRLGMILGLVPVLVLVAVLCTGIYALAIYTLPLLGGLAMYAVSQQVGAPPLIAAAASVVAGALSLAGARAGVAASDCRIRLTTLALIGLPAAYAGFVATSQLAAVAGLSTEPRFALATMVGLVIGGLGIERLGQSKPGGRLPLQCQRTQG
jgi:hypothetical protein